MNNYDVIITWSPIDKKYIAVVPDLPGCMADGTTKEEALKNSEQVVREWIEAAESLGRKIPSPQIRTYA